MSMTETQVSVLLLVAQYMGVRQMFHLARLCKRMRTALMKKANRHVWKAMLMKEPSAPPCPRHLIEPHYVSIICGRECSACGKYCEEHERRVWAQVGWVLCDDCLEHNFIDEETLLGLYSVTMPNRPDGVRLPQRDPRSDLRRYLPHHANFYPSEEGEIVETNVYYRPEAELVLQHYLPLMESELLRDPTRRSLRKVHAMMEDQRVRHVSHVNEFADHFSMCFEVASEIEARHGPGVYTVRHEILRRVDTQSRGYELEDLQRRSNLHDSFLDQPVTSLGKTLSNCVYICSRLTGLPTEAWTHVQPKIWEVLANKRDERLRQKLTEGVRNIIYFYEELVQQSELSEHQRALLPTRFHVVRFPCVSQLLLECEQPPTIERMEAFVPHLVETVRSYGLQLPGIFCTSFEMFLGQHQFVPGSIFTPVHESDEVKAARLLGMAAALFTYREDWAKNKDPVVLPYLAIHVHWRTHHPSYWDGWDVRKPEGNGPAVHEPGVLHGMVPYAPSLLHIKALGLPDDISLDEMDNFVRNGQIQCQCGISRLAPYRGTWGWADLLAHCAYEDLQWEKIWARPHTRGHAVRLSFTRYSLWARDHGVGSLHYYRDVNKPPEYEADLRSLLKALQKALRADPGKHLLGCRLCCDLVGPGHDRICVEAFKEMVPEVRLNAVRQPQAMAHHLRTRHSLRSVSDEFLVFSE
ncbi:uncharacterized protein TRAVEDRAFT_53194 [Trametes versicolor FP-101664 SS1]|uniref:uncharacterized protein n=1 Tax=Trametes versicolor (strain FP-101664) TaxID=717944 RepID=UPI0004622793|nr:uncharacterized protein TRAVEDRAFT_53194 [Trametes versicolor FP-101664 SS1]EIW52755.1 hypothetical protein TRAVEDRAFT_53194 [Trametes versicolor FP-101664 SS1]